MLRCDPAEPEVFTAREVARAAGVPAGHIEALILGGEAPLLPGGFVAFGDAVRLIEEVQHLTGQLRSARLFVTAPPSTERRGVSLLVSGALHVVLAAVALALTGIGARTAATEPRLQAPARLVFIVAPGPGGGGGGGGLRQPSAPPPAQLKGRSAVKSPVSVPRVAERPLPDADVQAARQHLPEPQLPKPLQASPPATPLVVAPVVSAPADADDEPGVVVESPATAPSSGPGSDGGVGVGRGGGIGGGDEGVGPGSIAGTGGGPYRPGTGITPPSLQREVKPTYTEEGRRRGVEGDVLLEVVVRADGTVGAVRIVRGLGAGLDARAADAVRQWLFFPARRFGTPVDVLVEVAVEFRLR